MACAIVQSRYAKVLDPKFEEGNQDELYKMVRTEVKTLLKDGLFLQGGHDENAS
jgi:hypothetical protein